MKSGIRILVIGRDPALFSEGSESARRAAAIAAHFDEYHIVSFSGPGMRARSYGGKFFLWPTNSAVSLFWIFDALRIGWRITRERGISLLDAQDPFEAGLVAWVVARSRRIPFRVQVHTDLLSPWYRRASWKEYVRYLIACFLIPRADCVRVVSERIKNSLLSHVTCHKLNVSVLPIFTDLAPYRAAARDHGDGKRGSDAVSFVAIGRFIDREKNFSMLIRAMRDVSAADASVRLTIIGDGPDRRYYERMIRTLGLRECVILEGWQNDLPQHLANFDFLVLSSRYEGWGRVVLEAMAAGLGVIMTDVGLAREIVKDGENGIVLPVGDIRSLSRALIAVSRDRGLYERLRENARKTALAMGQEGIEAYSRAYAACLESCIK